MDPARILWRATDTLSRAGGPALLVGINRALPAITRAGVGRHDFSLYPNVVYQRADGRDLKLDIFVPNGPGPHRTLVGFHGGAWMAGRKENLHYTAAYFARRGFATVLVQYRLAQHQSGPYRPRLRLPGPTAGVVGCIEDVGSALRWVFSHGDRYGLNPTTVGVFGDSAGGHLSAYAALELAGRPDLPRIDAAVHWYGAFDFRTFARIPWHRATTIMKALFGEDWRANEDAWDTVSPLRLVGRQQGSVPPTLLLASSHDPLARQSVDYAGELEKHGHRVRLETFPRSVHGFMNLFWQPDAQRSLRHATKWFAEHMRRPSP